jgi:hypothetical protein
MPLKTDNHGNIGHSEFIGGLGEDGDWWNCYQVDIKYTGHLPSTLDQLLKFVDNPTQVTYWMEKNYYKYIICARSYHHTAIPLILYTNERPKIISKVFKPDDIRDSHCFIVAHDSNDIAKSKLECFNVDRKINIDCLLAEY